MKLFSPTALCVTVICALTLATSTTLRIPARADGPPSETPFAADAFVDSWGVDTHFAYRDTPYRIAQQKEVSALESSGIRHIREGLPNLAPDSQAILDDLCANGIKHSIGFGVHTTPDQIVQTIQRQKPKCIDEVEPQNEYDGSHDPDWASTIVAEQRLLYATVKAQPSFATIVVLGPPLLNLSHYADLGNLDSVSDAGNLHFSTCDGSPRTRRYKDIGKAETFARAAWPTKPIWTTEADYSDDVANSRCAVDESVAGSLILRTQLEQWLIRAPRTYWYAFSDQPTDRMFGDEGFVDPNGDPKPRYNAVKSVIGLLADPGPGFSTTPVRIAIESGVPVDHALFQKRDGTTFLFVWQEVESWDHVARTRRLVSPATASVALPSSIHSATSYGFDGTYHLVSHRLTPSSGRVPLAVSDGISIISFHP